MPDSKLVEFRAVLVSGFTNGKEVAERWKEQYLHSGNWGKLFGDKGSKQVYQEILAAGDAREAIEEVVEGESWTQIWCSAHIGYALQGVEFGGDETMTICIPCLGKAIKLADPERKDA